MTAALFHYKHGKHAVGDSPRVTQITGRGQKLAHAHSPEEGRLRAPPAPSGCQFCCPAGGCRPLPETLPGAVSFHTDALPALRPAFLFIHTNPK